MLKTAGAALPSAVLVLVALAGCDEGEAPPATTLSADEQTAADNLGAQIVRSGSVSGQGSADDAVTEEQAGCIAEGAVLEVGLAELQDYGILTEDLKVDKSIQGVRMTAEHADALATVFVECLDAERLFEERFLSTVPADRAAGATTCLERLVDREFVVTVLSSSFQGRATGDYDRLQDEVSACTGADAAGQ